MSAGQTLMVQGRFGDGQVRASYLVRPDGSIVAVGPAGPGPIGFEGREGHGPNHGPGREGPPPPPGCAPADATRPAP
jgi:hypothetical protein